MTTLEVVLLALAWHWSAGTGDAAEDATAWQPGGVRRLPPPARRGGMALAEALATRRSRRAFAPAPLAEEHVAQLCWAAQGVTDPVGHRTAPSAGGLFGLDLHGADAGGVWRYDPVRHARIGVFPADRRTEVARAAAQQEWIGDAPLVLAIAIEPARLAEKYGHRAALYGALEAGHAAQNVLLTATSLGLASVPVGAVDDPQIRRHLGLAPGRDPVYLVVVGHPAGDR